MNSKKRGRRRRHARLKGAKAPRMRAVVAEKPSVARDIARVMGASKEEKGYFSGGGLVVTWAIGHLVQLAKPHQINRAWKVWCRSMLPMLPEEWPLMVDKKRKDQFKIVKRILNRRRVAEVVCATDAGREGELIFRQIYEKAGSRKTVRRLWISSLTGPAIRNGFARLRAASEFDNLAAAARARSRADWLVGINLTRAYTLRHRPVKGDSGLLSVGRVQTPTLAMLVEREHLISNFVPEDYLELHAEFDAGQGQVYRGVYFKLVNGKRQSRLHPDGKEAGEILGRARAGRAGSKSVTRTDKRIPPPPLYDLAELQRHANRLYGFSAARTLNIAQALYEKHKAITYPRTGSRHISTDIAAELPRIASRVAAGFDPALIAEGTGTPALGKRFVDNAKVTDHHAIIPTGTSRGVRPNTPEAKVLDLVNRRLLQAWHRPHKYAATSVVTRVAYGAKADDYLSTGTAVEDEGWKVLDVKTARKSKAKSEPTLLGGLEKGQRVNVLDSKAVKRTTSPPRRFTEGTLLTAMESAGKTLDSKELSDAMKNLGIGTPATRAGTIETLLEREYVVRKGKQLRATDKGIRLIGAVDPRVCSPAMTGEWEAKLRGIERGQGEFDEFMRSIEDFVREVVSEVAEPPPLGKDPATGQQIYLMRGQLPPFDGPFVQLGEATGELKRTLLLPGMDPGSADVKTALKLLSLPRRLGMCNRTGEKVVAGNNRYGPYVRRGADEYRDIPDSISVFEITLEEACELLAPLGADPATGQQIYLIHGRSGWYVRLGEAKGELKRAYLLEGMDPDSVDLGTALKLLSLPRRLGACNRTGEEVVAGNNRHGPHVKRGADEYRDIPDGISVFEITLEEACELLAPLGADPATGQQIYLIHGRSGWYVRLGEAKGKKKPKRASVLPGMDPNSVDLKTALRLLSLPRRLGVCNRTGEEVVAGNNRHGLHVKRGADEYRDIPDGISPLDITLEQACELLDYEE